jgi:hypothetical protein
MLSHTIFCSYSESIPHPVLFHSTAGCCLVAGPAKLLASKREVLVLQAVRPFIDAPPPQFAKVMRP